MGEWLIYGSNGTQKATVKKLEYSGEFMGETSVTCDIYSPSPISFSIGDYLVYRGERFTIDYDATRLKQSRNNTYGKGYTYENMRFLSYVGELKKCEFLDFVPSDNLIHFSQLPDFSFYAETVKDLADRLQANLDRIYTGSKAWSVQVVQGFEGKENVNVSVSKATCFDALRMAYDQFEATFIIRGRTITIGTAGNELETDFKYGKGNGLKTIERSVDESDSLVTRLRAYGNTTNLPANYYKNIGMRVYAPIYEIYHVSTTGCDIHFVPKLKNTCFSDKNGQYNYWVTVSLDETLWLKAVASPNNHLSSTNYSVVTVGLYGSNTQAQVTQFLQQLQSGTYDKLYFKEGINVGAWPVEYREYAENVPNLMAIDRLMLPGFPELTTDPYIDASNISTLGVREKSVYFDGSDPDTPDIHPTLEGMTAAELRAAGYTIDLDAGDNGNLDEIAADATETDGSPITADGAFEGVDEVPGFKVTIKDIGFDINDYLSTETATLVMKTGMCGGREFTIVKVEKVGNKYVLECQRTEDISHYFPYNPYLIKAGDKFVLTNIEMPKAYIDAASQRLLVAAQAYIAKYSAPQWVYAIKMDDIWMQRQRDNSVSEASSYYWNIKEGDVMNVTDSDLGVDIAEVIDRLTIREGFGPIPEFEVVLRKEKPQGTIGILQNRVRQLELRNAEQADIIKRQQNYLTFIFGDTLADVMEQLDKKAETWYQANDPSLSWTTEEDKSEHVGDLWMDTSANGGKKTYIYRYTQGENPEYHWDEQYVPDEVFDEIDGKAEIFVEKPTAYHERDMWIIENGISSSDLPAGCVAGDIVISSTDSTSFNKAHWSKKDRYTDDSSLNAFLNGYTGTLTGIRQDITNAATAASNAQTSANNASSAAATAQAAANALDYLKQAYLADKTLIDHGLILSTIVALRDANNNVWSGISGAYDSTKLGNGIAAWYGGGMIDKEVSAVSNAAKSLFRFDGSGYVANGNLKWDANGNVTIQGYSINATTLQVGGSNVATQAMLDNFVSKAFFNRLFTAYDANGNAIVPNDTTTAISNLKLMVGTWTEQYLSALGLNSEGGGGGTGSVNSIKVAANVFRDPDADGIIDLTADIVSSADRTRWNAASTNSHSHSNKSVLDGITAGKVSSWDAVASIMGSDSDTVINKWNEVITFLDDISEESTLDGLLSAKANSSVTISAGNGLTGGGNLQANRTLSILLQTNSGLDVSSSGLKLDIVNNLTTNNTYKALSAAQGKALNDRLTILEAMFTREGSGTSADPYVIKANYGLYTDDFLSALGKNPSGGGSGGTGSVNSIKVAANVFRDPDADGIIDLTADIVSSADRTRWNAASTNSHSHSNKSVLDGITAGKVSSWDAVASLIGSDSDTVINKWNEVVAFLDTYTEADTLANLLSNKADKSDVYSSSASRTKNYVLAAPSSQNGAATFRKLVSADIPDLSSTYAAASRATALEGYFTNGVAKTAAKLSTVSKKAWGQTYWTSGGVPQDVDGTLTISGGELQIWNTADTSAENRWDMRFAWSGEIFQMWAYEGAYHDIAIGSTAAVTATYKGLYYDASEKRWGIGTSTPAYTFDVKGNIGATGSLSLVGTSASTRRIYFGDTDHYIELTSTGFHFTHGIYSDSFVSALGANSSGGGGGSFDEESMWTALGTTVSAKVIAASHIPSLAASKITSGTLAVARIPSLDISKISGLQDALDNVYTKTASDGRYYALYGGTKLNNSLSSTNRIALNDYKDTGSYYCTASADSAYIDNRPTSGNNAFRMWVSSTTGTSATYRRQRFQNFGSPDIYERTIGDSGVWSSWQLVQSNLANYATASSLNNYLPLSGGTMNNGVAICWKDKPSSGTASDLSLVSFSTTNNFQLGYDAAILGYNTYISGNNIYLRYGTSKTIGITLASDGAVSIANGLGTGSYIDVDRSPYGAISLGAQVNVLRARCMNAGTGIFAYNNVISLFGSGETGTTVNNLGVRLGSQSGATWISAGESGKKLSSQYTDMCNTESVYITADNQIKFFTNCANDGTSFVDAATINSSGDLTVARNVNATTFYGALSGNAATATTLATPRNIWGRSFNGSADIKGDLFLLSTASGTNINTPSAKLKFNSLYDDDTTVYRSPYIQGVGGSSYGRKRLGFFQSNATNYTDDFVEVMSILANGRVGIGDTTPSAALGVTGSIVASSEVTASSDERKKNIISNTKFNVKDIASARSVLFEWNDGRDKNENKRVYGGSIAQDWLGKADSFLMQDEDGFYSINYGALALCSAITIAREVVKHEDEITRLKKEVVKLRERVAELEERRIA